MAEYIEREAAYEKCGWYNTVNGKSVYAVRKDELAAIPAADVAPVRHGRWIDKPTGKYGNWQSWCSACGKHSGIGGIQSNQHKPYCPNCGAKMDLEVSE